MRRKFIAIAAIGISAVALASLLILLQQQPREEEFFVVDVHGERFVMRVTDPETIRLARENLEGRNSMHPSGELARGDGGFNQPWSWHLKPETVRMVEVSVELCDGLPSQVEENLDYWLNTVKRYCPWGGRVVAVGRDSGMTPTVKISLNLDKLEYRKGEAMKITISNPSTKTVMFPNAAYGLYFEVKTEEGWVFYTAPNAAEVITLLKPNEQATVGYTLGQDTDAPFDPGEYRAVVSGGVEGLKMGVTANQEFTVT